MARRARFVPRADLEHVSDWESAAPRWKTPATLDDAMRVAASRTQQRLAHAMRAELRARDWTVLAFAEAVATANQAAQIRQKLDGAIPARLEDLLLWAWFTGIDPTLDLAPFTQLEIDPDELPTPSASRRRRPRPPADSD